MTVFVVMGDDFPDSVFSDVGAAEAYCNRRNRENKDGQARIHWRVYDFKLDTAGK